jgi:hypothetical protein
VGEKEGGGGKGGAITQSLYAHMKLGNKKDKVNDNLYKKKYFIPRLQVISEMQTSVNFSTEAEIIYTAG